MSQADNRLVNYSLQEQWTGKYWVDGKKVYEKTIDCGNLTWELKTAATGVANISTLISMKAVAQGTTGTMKQRIVLPHMNDIGEGVKQIAMWLNGTTLTFQSHGFNYAYLKCYATFVYTCTDR